MADLRTGWPGRGWRLLAATGLAGATMPCLAMAQDSVSRPVVQALPDPAASRLSEALQALARSPQSADALVEAGLASLALDDTDAAKGFFSRAQALSPLDVHAKAGMAAVLVREGQPASALALFDEAEGAGADLSGHAADRGLAYDLVGNNAAAQAQYRIALQAEQDTVVLRRLAISQAIAGDQSAAEATLLPMLERQDLAAYRARAFALAILGKPDEAVTIAETLLPESMSNRMAPYLRFMPRLTRAQQAAAANLGRFPQAAAIGRDDPQLAALAAVPVASVPPRPTPPAADARLVPTGAPLGKSGSAGGELPPAQLADAPITPASAVTRAPPTKPAITRTEVAAKLPTPRPFPSLEQDSPDGELSGPYLAAGGEGVVQTELSPETAAPPALEPELAQTASAQSVALTSESAAEAPVEISLVEAFSDFAGPVEKVGAEAGAVDISAITPPREKPKPPPPPPAPPPPEPSREWVQIATGRDLKALAFDWRRLKRGAGDLLANQTPYTASWGQTNRLVVGPIASGKKADDLVAALKAKGLDCFRFTSEKGEKVNKLD